MTDTLQEFVRTAFQKGRNMLSEADSARVLTDTSIPMVPTIRCGTPEEAGANAQSLPFPAALKRSGSTLAHKSVISVSLLTDAESRSLYRFDGCDYKSLFSLSPEQAVKALARMVQYQTWRQR